MKIVFFGTPEFAVESLRRLMDEGKDICAVVTMPDKVGNRGHKVIESDVKKFAVSRGLPVLQPSNLKSPEFIARLRDYGADLFIVIAFRMLPKEVWQMPRLGTFNLHASLLPKYRGAAPINRAVMNGDTVTGITTFFLKHEIDTGDIIQQREIGILPDDNAGTVHDKLMMLGAEMVAATVDAIENGTVSTRPQPEGEFTPAPKIFREDCNIDWNHQASAIHNQVRGLTPYPGTHSIMVGTDGSETDIKIYATRVSGEPCTGTAPGTVVADGKTLKVATADEWLCVAEVQPAGKRRMDAQAYMRGYSPLMFK